MRVQAEVLGEEITKRVREVMDGKDPDFSYTLPAGETETCAWCAQPFGFGRLFDGEVIAFELETWDGEQRVNFARPHRCAAEPDSLSEAEAYHAFNELRQRDEAEGWSSPSPATRAAQRRWEKISEREFERYEAGQIQATIEADEQDQLPSDEERATRRTALRARWTARGTN